MPTTSPSHPCPGPRLRAGTTQSPYPSTGAVHLEAQLEADDAATELLHELMHSHPPSPFEEIPSPVTREMRGLEIDKVALEVQTLERAARPWWQRPSATWFIVLSPLGMLAGSALIAPRLQLYTDLMCKEIDDPTYGIMASTRTIPCAADPIVQAKVAKFLTITATVDGILSCLTATFWGSFSDRYGRVKFLGLNVTTLLLADAALTYLAVAPEHVPGGYWFLLLTSAFEGLIGGRSAASAALHAYLADCSSPATRSRIFSRFLGLVFIGLALGPSLGGIAEHFSGNPYIVFYVALGLHTINALFQWFVIPESLLPAQMDAAQRVKSGRGKGHWFGRIFSPLSVLAPLPAKAGVNPQGTLKKDWSLTWLALSLGPESLLIGGMQYSLQYAAGKFYWSSEMVGYYISLIGITRALFLVIGLPVILRLFAPRNPPIQLPTSPAGDEPLNASSSPPRRAAHARGHGPGNPHTHTPAVDLGIARMSLVVQIICFTIIAVSKDARMFVAAGALGALAMAYSPTTHSLSLELYTRRGGLPSEAGRLFGAMSVIQTVGNQVVGPSLFGVIFIRTVSTLPETIFYVCVGIGLLSFCFLLLVRIPPHRLGDVIDAEVEGPVVIDVPTIVMNDDE